MLVEFDMSELLLLQNALRYIPESPSVTAVKEKIREALLKIAVEKDVELLNQGRLKKVDVDQRRGLVRRFVSAGWNPRQIADKMNLPIEEVMRHLE